MTAGTGKKDEFRFSLPCFFHNLSNFDAHLLVAALKPRHLIGERFSCIPKTMEKYISFNAGLIDYRDSYQFAQSSLEKLSSLLKPEVRITDYRLSRQMGTTNSVLTNVFFLDALARYYRMCVFLGISTHQTLPGEERQERHSSAGSAGVRQLVNIER